MKTKVMGFWFAIISALFFSLNVPATKLLLVEISPYWLASLLYFGAGIGTLFYRQFVRDSNGVVKIKHQTIWFILMIILDIIAPIFFLIGAKETNGTMVGLLSNVELVFTFILAGILFKEMLHYVSWIALFLILAGVTFSNFSTLQFQFQIGQLWIIFATLLWGLENNVSKKLSLGNPLNVVIIKGIATGIGTLLIALFLGESSPTWSLAFISLMTGFVIYGGSLIFYVNAQRTLGAATVQMIQSFAPLAGGIMAFFIFREAINATTIVGYVLVLFALILIGWDVRQSKRVNAQPLNVSSPLFEEK